MWRYLENCETHFRGKTKAAVGGGLSGLHQSHDCVIVFDQVSGFDHKRAPYSTSRPHTCRKVLQRGEEQLITAPVEMKNSVSPLFHRAV